MGVNPVDDYSHEDKIIDMFRNLERQEEKVIYNLLEEANVFEDNFTEAELLVKLGDFTEGTSPDLIVVYNRDLGNEEVEKIFTDTMNL